jgi:hypothetical protein
MEDFPMMSPFTHWVIRVISLAVIFGLLYYFN